ncbi:MAG: hypothetical protein Q7I99_06865 [Acholeplasmataceae bacterium]|nr:hypothetical protein [Acholeplasmataceae bacterium]
MKLKRKLIREIIQVIFILIPVIFFMIAIPSHSVLNFLVLWFLELINNIVLSAVIYFFLFSLISTYISYHISKQNNVQFLSEKNISIYYKLIILIAITVIFSMLMMTIFTSNKYSINRFLAVMLISFIVYLLIYIPSLFVEMIENSRFLSFIYLLLIHLTVQFVLFLPFYLAYFMQGV